jgi:hypothetical protein
VSSLGVDVQYGSRSEDCLDSVVREFCGEVTSPVDIGAPAGVQVVQNLVERRSSSSVYSAACVRGFPTETASSTPASLLQLAPWRPRLGNVKENG